MSREHEPDSLDVELWHVPEPQVNDVRDRVRVPLSSQVPEKLPQDDHAPTLSLPQVVPFVLRVHERDSVVVRVAHDAPTHS